MQLLIKDKSIKRLENISMLVLLGWAFDKKTEGK